VERGGDFEIRIRIPSWVEQTGRTPALRVNGRAVTTAVRPGTYAVIRRTWQADDVVELVLPMGPVWLPAPDNPAVHALTHGPLVLAGRYGDAGPATLPTATLGSLTPGSGHAEYTLEAGGETVRLSPLLDVHHEHYNVYWAFPPIKPAPKLVARYGFDDPAGSLDDATGQWPAATLVGGASLVPRESGGAVALDGAGGHVVLPEGLPSGLTELTLSMWVRLESVTNSARVFDLGSNAQTYMFLAARTGRGTPRFAMKLGGMQGEDFVDSDRPLPIGAWTHVAVTVSDRARLYLDGVQVGANDNLVMSPLLLGRTQRNYLGRSQNVKHPWLHGAVDDFRLYGVDLAPADITALHEGTFTRYE
jgi:hypothetical protein